LKLNILFSLINYSYLTGAELYVYELSREFIYRGHEVTIISPRVGGEIAERTRKYGVNIHDFNNMPSDLNPDILHVMEYMPAEWAIHFWPETPAVATVHSEYPCERPYIHKNIKRYICIRPTVVDKIKKVDKIPPSRIRQVCNGIDFRRFHKVDNESDKRLIVFPGTIDYLRREAHLHLIGWANEEGFDILLIGKKHDTYLPPDVRWIDSVWDIERYIQEATETAGILLGRTTIEGWACGKPGWIYDIDLAGRIKSLKLHDPPKDIEKYNITNVATQILEIYNAVIH